MRTREKQSILNACHVMLVFTLLVKVMLKEIGNEVWK
jgi:hypothetical protein